MSYMTVLTCVCWARTWFLWRSSNTTSTGQCSIFSPSCVGTISPRVRNCAPSFPVRWRSSRTVPLLEKRPPTTRTMNVLRWRDVFVLRESALTKPRHRRAAIRPPVGRALNVRGPIPTMWKVMLYSHSHETQLEILFRMPCTMPTYDVDFYQILCVDRYFCHWCGIFHGRHSRWQLFSG